MPYLPHPEVRQCNIGCFEGRADDSDDYASVAWLSLKPKWKPEMSCLFFIMNFILVGKSFYKFFIRLAASRLTYMKIVSQY